MSLDNDISLKSIGEVTSYISRGITPSYTEEKGVKVINQRCIRNNSIDFENSRLTDSQKKKIPKDKYLQKYDVLINSTGVGTLGRSAQIKELCEPITVDSHVTILRPNDSINPLFFGYAIQMLEKNIENLAEGSTGQTELSRIRLSDEIFINNLPLNLQKKISFILSNIDKKISINQQLNKNLFKLSNVINSDFIKSIDNNKQCSFIDLKELGNIVMGQSPKGESYNYDKIGLPLINGAADYENGYLKAQKYTSDPKKTCEKNDLIFCIRATIGLLIVCDQKYCLGRGVAGITNIDPIYKEYAFHLIYSSIENFKRAATGSVISGISRKDIENIDVKIPSFDEINKYHKIQKPIFDKLENNRIEINNLIKLRDTLLPKLMSGEIDVSEINCDF